MLLSSPNSFADEIRSDCCSNVCSGQREKRGLKRIIVKLDCVVKEMTENRNKCEKMEKAESVVVGWNTMLLEWMTLRKNEG